MSITDELRTWMYGHTVNCSDNRIALVAIADRIDAEHEDKVQQAHADGLNEQMDFHDNFVPSNYILLPVDADGVPWHIGDRTESGQTIQAMGLNKHGWHFVGTVNEIDPSIHRHHHAPTVEDVLREFTDAILEWSGKNGTVAEVGTWSDVAAEYAAKLSLAEGDA